MNLNDFKLLKEDAQSYHIAHPSGMKMSVSKVLLSEQAKKAIKKMCAGGEVKKMDEGGIVDTIQRAVAPDFYAAEQAKKNQQLPPPEYPPDIVHSKKMADGGEVPAALAVDPAPNASDVPPASLTAAPVAEVPVAAQAPAAPVEAPATSTDPIIQHGMSTDQLLSKEQSDIGELAKGQIGEAGASAKAYKEYNDTMAKMKTPDQIMADYKGKDDALMKSYLDNKIDPDRYVNHMSTGSRIRAGIAMALGGLGQGLIGGSNPAIDWFHKTIENDIESQKNDQSKTMNVWKMNREAMGDDMRANVATQNQLWTGVQAKIAQTAAAAQAPVAKFRAQQMINDIEQRKIQNRQTLGLMTQGMQGGGSFSQADPAQLVGQMVPKELQPKAYEEIGRAQNVAKNKEAILKAFDQAAEEAKGASGIMSAATLGHYETPGMKALQQLLLPNFKQVDGTVRQAAMDETFKNVVPSPWNMGAGIDAKRKSLQKWMESETAAPVSKGSGIDLQRFSSTSINPVARLPAEQQQIYNWAKAHPSEEKAKMALEKFKGLGIN